MAILKRTGTILLAAGAAATMVALSAAPAFAATTWTVKPGGAITAKAGKTTLKDPKTGTTLTCTSSSAKGSLKSGKGLSGFGIGKISALSFSGCTGPLGITFTVKTSAFPWHLNALSYSSGVTTGTITHIHAKLSGPSCTAIVDGTGAFKDNGKVKVKYVNGTGKLKVTGGGNLHIYKVNGCAGLIHSGDPSSFVGVYAVSPKQTITSP